MTGVLGWVGMHAEHPSELLAAMARKPPADDSLSLSSHHGSGFGIAAIGLPGTSGVFTRHGLIVAMHGHVSWREREDRHAPMAEVAARLLDAFLQRGVEAFGMLRGDYAVALIDPSQDRAVLAVDRMSVRNIVYCEERGGIAFGPTCDTLSRHPAVVREVDPQALYDYAYFHMVPGPTTVFRRQRRVPPATSSTLPAVGALCKRTGVRISSRTRLVRWRRSRGSCAASSSPLCAISRKGRTAARSSAAAPTARRCPDSWAR